MVVDPPTRARLVRARDLLEAEGNDALTIRELAAAIRLSQYHFIRVFRAVFGETPHQLRTRARLERAKAVLAAGATVTEACVEVGFSSLGSFSGLFTRWIGAPPSAYRARVAAARAPAPTVPGCLGLLGELPRAAWSNSREAPRAAR